MPIISCADCGEERKASAANTRYCRVCRLLRNLDFLSDRTHKCLECSSRYPPIMRNDQWCGDCALGQTNVRGCCALCGKEDAYLVLPDVRVCHRCARNPRMRRRFILGLRKRQDEQRAANETQEAFA